MNAEPRNLLIALSLSLGGPAAGVRRTGDVPLWSCRQGVSLPAAKRAPQFVQLEGPLAMLKVDNGCEAWGPLSLQNACEQRERVYVDACAALIARDRAAHLLAPKALNLKKSKHPKESEDSFRFRGYGGRGRTKGL